MEQHVYKPLTAITTAHAVLSVAQRSVRSLADVLSDGEYAIHEVEMNTRAFELRVITDGTADDENDIEVYKARGRNDDWVHAGQIKTTQGLQQRGSKFYVDTMVITSVDTDTLLEAGPQALDGVCRATVKTGGYDRFLFIVSTKASGTTNVRIQTAEVDAAELELQHDMSLNSNRGGTGQMVLADDADSALASITVKSVLVWTALAGVYLHIGATAAASNFLLPTSQMVPVPVDNLNLVNIHNAGGEEATVYYMYRR